MKHVIIGTAGHVDHGKTLLVKALTGIDTDRLAEEKKRGITIDLGFAYLDLGEGMRVGLVDVPGHERFIGNMLAGAGGIDLAMLVVAADEGFMPQTTEHLNILRLLNLRRGLVVITKTDLVDAPWLELVTEDVREQVRGSFLEGAPILPVSAVTGAGIPSLRRQLYNLVRESEEKTPDKPFRLPVDRVFSVEGFGTVVTGTLIEGSIRSDAPAQLMPSGLSVRVRSIQTHGQPVDLVSAGQRAAVNLAGVKRSQIHRGDTLCCPGSLQCSRMLDVRLENLPDSGRVIQTQSRVHLYHGASSVLAKVVLLDRDSLPPGSAAYAQLRLAQPVAAKDGDRFVIRFYSPQETIGGGKILDTTPARHKAGDAELLTALITREKGSDDQKLMQSIIEAGLILPNANALGQSLGWPMTQLQPQLLALLESGQALELLPGRYLAAATLEKTWTHCRSLLEAYHGEHPLQSGMKQAELRQKLFLHTEPAVAEGLLARLAAEGRIRRCQDRYALAAFTPQLTPAQTAIRDQLLERYRAAGIKVPEAEEVCAAFPAKAQRDCRQVLDSLISAGQLVMLAPQFYWHAEVYATAAEQLHGHFAAQETLTLAQCRDLLGTSRKYALVFLEHCDRNRWTKKEGDLRRAGPGLVKKAVDREKK